MILLVSIALKKLSTSKAKQEGKRYDLTLFFFKAFGRVWYRVEAISIVIRMHRLLLINISAEKKLFDFCQLGFLLKRVTKR